MDVDISGVLGQPIAEGAFAFVYKIIFKGKPVAVKKIKFEKDEVRKKRRGEVVVVVFPLSFSSSPSFCFRLPLLFA